MHSLHQKLQIVQTKLKAPKSQFNKFGGYNYRSLEDIMEAVKPLLEDVGAYITVSDELVCFGENAQAHTHEFMYKGEKKVELLGGPRYYVKATAKFSDGETVISTTAYAREPENKKGMDESQITGAASTYSRKYALNGLLAIDDTKDADATNKHGQNDNEKPKQQAAKTPEPEDVTPVLEKAYEAFQQDFMAELPKGSIFSFQKWQEELKYSYKVLSPADRKSWKWDEEHVTELAKKVDPTKCMIAMQEESA